IEEVQQQENDTEQHDAATDEAVAQIAEQHDCGLGARDMGAGRYDQRSDDHLFYVRKYFLGDRLDMFGIERQPPGPDLRHLIFRVFPTTMNESFTTAGPRSRSKKAGHSDPRILTSTIGRHNKREKTDD